MGAKAVIRDVARVMGFSFGEADRIAKLVPASRLNITLDDALEKSPSLAEQVKRDQRVGELWAWRAPSRGAPARLRPCLGRGHLRRAPHGARAALQGPKRPELNHGLRHGPIEKLGPAQDGLPRPPDAHRHRGRGPARQGVEGDRPRSGGAALDDAKAYQMLAEARTFGVFQLESAGMRDALKSLKPTRIQDIIGQWRPTGRAR